MAARSIRWPSGVLPIALGEATKLAGRMLDADKVYDFTIRFGEETDTLDAEGAVVATSDVRPTLAEIEAVLPRFTGPIEQVPPAYSALKVDGKRAYDLARAGEEVELKSRARHRSRALGRRGRADADEVTLSRPRLQGHLYPQPRPRHRAGARQRSAMSPCCGGPRPGRSPSNGRFRWTNWTKPLRAAPLNSTSCR